MSSRTRKHLIKTADLLEKAANGIVNAMILVLTDLFWGKAKYRKRPSQPRPIVHRTIVYRSAPRVVVVDRTK